MLSKSVTITKAAKKHTPIQIMRSLMTAAEVAQPYAYTLAP